INPATTTEPDFADPLSYPPDAGTRKTPLPYVRSLDFLRGRLVRPQNVRTGRPDGAPKPSISASAPSRAASRPCTSRSQARFSSLGSFPKAASASLSSLSNVRDLRCKLTTWVHQR